ncbi:HlyD family efflux transporter periplasmic adaptor subunit [Novosphingobium sp. PASSN1]|uniref:HlyD family secretion protein n=1 Tax=Novosphingobium sp. PASSN1 TaxID=2015561 RepID=UPI000BD4E5A9|nr:HlyD family efflux transporter periplasmic adaptor subunit [Novosphingobium sp. PASSN1]OYU35250.1 MAG: EmrA/EmrK family multidrug efflux transporter periplasmic adaptor subunit [Novosphingobium sp. PASSN1]
MAERDPQIMLKTTETTPPVAAPVDAGAKRKRGFAILGGVVLAAGVVYGGYELLFAGRYVETDNAYVAAEIAPVTALAAGTVIKVAAIDTAAVKKGDVLLELDPADARIAVAEAEAAVAQALRRVNQTVATGTALDAQVSASEADIRRRQALVGVAAANLARARLDLTRREALVPGGAVSGEELSSARNAFAAAQGQLAVAEADLAQARASRGSAAGQSSANAALVGGTLPAENPDVLAAKARLERAKLDLARTVIRAPVDGIVTQRAVQVGQRVAPGAVLMTVVPLGDAHVDANFKESQLRRVTPGQPVELTSDLYGGGVVFHGRVVGFSGSTGSAQALIPAQNATGNWIKVVQRLPVRVALDPKELKAHPLRIGLSMTATIDTGAK